MIRLIQKPDTHKPFGIVVMEHRVEVDNGEEVLHIIDSLLTAAQLLIETGFPADDSYNLIELVRSFLPTKEQLNYGILERDESVFKCDQTN